jgi:hypothetical protein
LLFLPRYSRRSTQRKSIIGISSWSRMGWPSVGRKVGRGYLVLNRLVGLKSQRRSEGAHVSRVRHYQLNVMK